MTGPYWHPSRTYVVAMFKRGELATLEEGAKVAGTKRETVARWLRYADVDWAVTRSRYLAKKHTHCETYAAGLPPSRKLTKRQLSHIATREKAKWDAKRAAELERLEAAIDRDIGPGGH